MSSVPILTIPETSYDPSIYSLKTKRGKSQLLIYLIKLTHGSGITLIIAYVLGLFVLKPLLETNATRRLEVLELVRGKVRDLYLNLIGRVSYIPIVGIKRPGSNKLYADAVVQTDDSLLDRMRIIDKNDPSKDDEDKLGQGRLYNKLKQLSTRLTNDCRGYDSMEMHSYKSVNYAIRDLQSKADMIYFNSNDLFVPDTAMLAFDNKLPKRNLAVEARNEIRSIKGLYMSGQA
ncbi:uncharacterized protein J8A68_004205 [[Candida] subhashii]|uniref:Uncharacterized protein n=1 Tax=[Candida] subhashii TaxID=561895 RepID=A0A8J5UKU0_9ASCO|nr:uncharacterized protein J8A68_004205 [[Candida] subhashii]KAG7662311.1 hypothetical protein J8A68_004205 [[Candida] subhashii]